MLQELAGDSGGAWWAIGSMFFFLAVYAGLAIRVWRAGRDEMDTRARLVLDEPDPEPREATGRTGD
jgi:hypothetical protein